MIAIYNSITVPLEICFDPEIDQVFAKFHYKTLDTVFSCVFFTDIALNSITTFYDTDGEEIFDKARIFKNYIAGPFIIDLVSSLPLPKPYKFFNMLKIVRLRKLSGLIDKLDYDEDSKSVSYLFVKFRFFSHFPFLFLVDFSPQLHRVSSGACFAHFRMHLECDS